MRGDPKAWKQMIQYNKRDVELLEKIYLHLRPWVQNHPNISILEDKPNGCPNCGSLNLQKRGRGITQTGVYQKYQCNECGSWSSGIRKKVTDIK